MTYHSSRLGRSGKVIAECIEQSRPALICYLPVGYPTVDDSIRAFETACEAGADIIEIGMPYSDPVLDGPVIQRATTTALAAGVRTADAFIAAGAIAAKSVTPVVMTYWNLDAFARDLVAAGGAGVIIPDLIPEEGERWIEVTDAHELDRMFLIAPSSSDERIAMTMDHCRGWVYATSVMGVTGVRQATSEAAPVIVQRAKALRQDLPLGVGLGVSNADQAAEIGSYADAVIVGSALLRAMGEDGKDLDGLGELVTDLAAGVARARK